LNFPFFIARRYLVSKKKQNIINIISGVAVSGVAIGTIALVVVLSVFNGIDSLVKSLFSSFDPDMKITPIEGKTFDPKSFNFEGLKKLEGVAFWAEILEKNVMLKYANRQGIATIKGVSGNYRYVTGLDSLMVNGNFTFENDGFNYAIVGLGVANSLGISLSFAEPIHVYSVKKGKQISLNITKAFNRKNIFPSGIFSVQEQIDSKYVLTPLGFARQLFDEPVNISSIEIKLKPDANVDDIQQQIQRIAGEKFHVKNKYQQHELIYRIMNSEKWAIFLILSFILVIASFNILGSLSMLIIDKKNDIAILKSMGASHNTIKRIFLFEGWLISLFGAVLGVILGVLTCWAQIQFGVIKFPGNGSFAVSAYPVEIHYSNLILIFITVLLIGFLAAWYPVRYISGKYITIQE